MKIAVLTSPQRFDSYSDKSMIPADTEIVYIGGSYTTGEVVEKAGDADAILVDAILPVNAEMIAHMPKLKLIQSEGVGFDMIDTEAAKASGVFVCNNRAVNAGQVAEHAVMLILAVLRRLLEGDAMVRNGKQIEAKTQFIMEGLNDLMGCRVGLLGFGAIGKELAKRLAPFGCTLSYYDAFRASAEVEAEYGVTYLEQEELLRTSDIISLHLPVTPETTGLICQQTLNMMKPNAVVINTARGAIINSADLAEAIVSNRIYGAGLDTLDPEPVRADDPMVTLPEEYRWRVVLSPHIAGTTKSVFYASYRNFWNNVAAVCRGERPINVVNGL